MKAIKLVISILFFSQAHLALGSTCPSAKQLEEMSEPPFYLSEFLEFKNLKTDQKNKYFVELEKIAGISQKIKIPLIKDLKAKSTDECAWEELRLQIHLQCKVLKTDKKICSRLEEARIEALRVGQTRP